MKTTVWVGILLPVLTLIGNLQAATPNVPEKVEPTMAGFTKIVIKWKPVKDAASYKIYRNDTIVGTTDTAEYSDLKLTPGTAYFYKVISVNADGESESGKPVEIHTLALPSGEGGEVISQAVDSLSPGTVTAKNLLTTVQGALKVLKVLNTDLVSIDPAILQKMIDNEMDINDDAPIKPGKNGPKPAGKIPPSGMPSGVPPGMLGPPQGMPIPQNMPGVGQLPPNIKGNGKNVAAAVSNDDKLSLDEYMAKYFKGHSFLDLYIQYKLTELAEMHWQAGKKKAALMLYEKSLSYLSDMPDIVFSSVFRMGHINFSHITLKSSKDDMLEALQLYQETMGRYTKMFPNENDPNNIAIHKLIAARCYQLFPAFLSYEDYNRKILDYALSHLKTVKEINGADPIIDQLIERYNGWRLGGMKVRLCNAQGKPVAGTVVLKDITIKDAFESVASERTLDFSGSSTVLVPIYHGHVYDFSVSVPIADGKPLRYTAKSVPHDYGTRIIYSPYKMPTAKKLPNKNEPANIILVMDRPQTPYNLKTNITGNKFTIAWDWVKPVNDYQLKEFKVYCDGEEIGASVKQSYADIPIDPDKKVHTYTVCANDVYGKLSPESPAVNVPEKIPDPIVMPTSVVNVAAMQPPATSNVKTSGSTLSKHSKSTKSKNKNGRSKRDTSL